MLSITYICSSIPIKSCWIPHLPLTHQPKGKVSKGSQVSTGTNRTLCWNVRQTVSWNRQKRLVMHVYVEYTVRSHHSRQQQTALKFPNESHYKVQSIVYRWMIELALYLDVAFPLANFYHIVDFQVVSVKFYNSACRHRYWPNRRFFLCWEISFAWVAS